MGLVCYSLYNATIPTWSESLDKALLHSNPSDSLKVIGLLSNVLRRQLLHSRNATTWLSERQTGKPVLKAMTLSIQVERKLNAESFISCTAVCPAIFSRRVFSAPLLVS